MKTRMTWFLLLGAAFGAVVWISSPLSATEETALGPRNKNVVMTKNEIILPGTTVSQKDAEAINKILSHYDKTLFRVNVYENGKRKKSPQGELTDVITDKRLASETATAVKHGGFSQYAFQIRGVLTDPTKSPTPKSSYYSSPVPSPSTDPTRSTQNSKTSTADSFKRLQEILKKYQKK